jgi:hypothetical protein
MAFQSKFRVLGLTCLALAFAHTAFADSSCAANGSGGTTCNLFYNGATTSFTLAETVGAGYLVIINGNPQTISSNDTNEAALYAPPAVSEWEAVLDFPDTISGDLANTLDVFFAGSFPAGLPSLVQTTDEGLYGPGDDSALFFVQATGSDTVYAPSPDEYNVVTSASATPEPSSFILLFSGLSGAGLLARFKRVRPSQA